MKKGAFNYAKSAEYDNSEKVLVTQKMPELIAKYQAHFASRWAVSEPYKLNAQG
ncbi:hypothetical protein ACLBW2_05340 [Enterobacteriaceae bacterium C23F]